MLDKEYHTRYINHPLELPVERLVEHREEHSRGEITRVKRLELHMRRVIAMLFTSSVLITLVECTKRTREYCIKRVEYQ